MGMKVAILMVTYGKDLEFAERSLRSIEKFASGFSEVRVVVPYQDWIAFNAIAGSATVDSFVEAKGKGMVHHMAMICRGDMILPEADAILHMDADCLFTEPVTPADYIVNGKPVLVRQRYEDFKETQRTRYSWKKCVLAATGIDPEWETMCRHPSVHLPCVYAKTRELIRAWTGIDYESYILSCRNEFPQTFAEFPTLGAVAWEYFRDRYDWVDVKDTPRPKLKDFWSHGGMDMVNDRHPNQTARQAIADILK